MTTEPKKRDPFSDWRPAAGTRQYCGELELTIPIGRDAYCTITADPDTAAMVPAVLRQLLAQPEPEGLTDQDLDDLANEMLDWNCEGWRAYARAAIAADRARYARPTIEPLLAAILLNRLEPLALHHVGALRELLEYPTDDELRSIINPGPFRDHH